MVKVNSIMLCKTVLKRGSVVFLVLTLALLFLPISFADGIHIYREYPNQSRIGSVIQINITVENLGLLEITATIQENVGDYTVIEPPPVIPKGTPGMIGLRPPYFEWNITVGPMQNETVYYRVNLTSPGEIMFSPTAVITRNETFYTEPSSIKVICNQNGVCEQNLSESYLTCPEDCPTGAADGICDLMRDGRCDPDCTKGADVDCSYCGNGICDSGETQDNCPGDCPKEEAKGSKNDSTAEPSEPEGLTYILILAAVLALIVIALVFLYLKKRSSKAAEAKPEAPTQSSPRYQDFPQ